MSQGSDDRVSVYLALESLELTPSMLTDRLGAPPDRSWTKGDSRGRTGKRWECHGWEIEITVRSKDHPGQPMSALIGLALEDFDVRVAGLAKATAQLRGPTQIYVVLGVVSEEIPGIELSHRFLELTASLGGTLQIDLTV